MKDSSSLRASNSMTSFSDMPFSSSSSETRGTEVVEGFTPPQDAAAATLAVAGPIETTG